MECGGTLLFKVSVPGLELLDRDHPSVYTAPVENVERSLYRVRCNCGFVLSNSTLRDAHQPDFDRASQ